MEKQTFNQDKKQIILFFAGQTPDTARNTRIT